MYTPGGCWQLRTMDLRLPLALQASDDDAARSLLRRYFGSPYRGPRSAVGAEFDAWAPGGDPNRFEADDLLAITFLSVRVPTEAVRKLLRDRADEFSGLLVELGPDRDLADEPEPLVDSWVGWELMRRLRSIPGVGHTTGTKLLARKRPRLRPIWDDLVAEVTGSQRLWEPLRVRLRADDRALHRRLLRLRAEAGLPETVSVLRVFDAIAWREGRDRRPLRARR
jgi:hypothetical protein